MQSEQVINLVATGIAVGAVVYGYVKNKNAAVVVAQVTDSLKSVATLQAMLSQQLNALKGPLDAAVKQLPKTRSKKNKDVEPEQVQ